MHTCRRNGGRWGWALLATTLAAMGAMHGQVKPPPPPRVVNTYQEGMYDIHIWENAGCRDKAAKDRSVLVLGLNSTGERTFDARRLVNPATGKPYDVVIGLGASPRGLEDIPDHTLAGEAREFALRRAANVREIRRVVLQDHLAAKENTEALQSAIQKQFGAPLEAGSLDVHSNGTTVGISAVLGGVVRGVHSLNVMGPDIGYGGKYLNAEHLAQLKRAGVSTVDVYRIDGDAVPLLGLLTAAFGKDPPAAQLTAKAGGAVRAMIKLAAASGETAANAPFVRYHQLPAMGGPLANHFVDSYLDIRNNFIHRMGGRVTTVPAGGDVMGVRLYMDDAMLARVLEANETRSGDMLLQLGRQLKASGDDGQRSAAVAEFIRQSHQCLRGLRPMRQIDSLTAVSVKALVQPAAGGAAQEAASLGGISRIHGYVLDAGTGDLFILGRRVPNEPAATLDDLVTAVRTVWKQRQTPLCSLDPDVQDMSGPQNCRVAGVPNNSLFALKMLQADYQMKRIMGEVRKVQAPPYASYLSLLRKSKLPAPVRNRFWLCPRELGTGDVMVSPDGACVLFSGGVQVLSEQMILTRQGLAGSGHFDSAAQQAAESFTQCYASLACEANELAHLQTLADMVLLARTWSVMNVQVPCLAQLAALPTAVVDVPRSYPGIRVDVFESTDSPYRLEGGVQFNAGLSARHCVSLDTEKAKAVRSAVASAGGGLARDLGKLSLEVAAPAAPHTPRADWVTAAWCSLGAGQLQAAATAAQKAVEDDSASPEALLARGTVRFYQGRFEASRLDARRARQIDAANPPIVMAASVLLFQCAAIEGEVEVALKELDQAAAADADNAAAHVLRGDALTSIQQAAAARTEYRRAVELEPANAEAYAGWAVLELSQGWVMKGRSLARKAMALSPDSPSAKVALAMVQMQLEHADEAEKLAADALSSGGCDPTCKLRAAMVQLVAAAAGGQWDRVQALLQEAQAIAPGNPAAWLAAAAACQKARKDQQAAEYLLHAKKIAPNHPAVKLFGKSIQKGEDHE